MWIDKELLYAICFLVVIVVLWVSSEELKIKIKGSLTVLVAGVGAALSYMADGSEILDVIGSALFFIGMWGFYSIKRKMKKEATEDEA